MGGTIYELQIWKFWKLWLYFFTAAQIARANSIEMGWTSWAI